MRALGFSAAIGILAATLVSSPRAPGERQVQAPRAAAPGPQETAAAVSGVVVRVDGAGASGATVELLCPGQPALTAVTDVRGRFRFAVGAGAVCEVRARVEGMVPATARVAVNALAGPPLRLVVGIALGDGGADLATAMAQRTAPRAELGGPGGVVGGVAGAFPPTSSALPVRAAGDVVAQSAIVRPIAPPPGDFNTAAYDRVDDNAFRRVFDEPLSTFSTDVDTASYSNVRRFLNGGALPPPDAVRIEELVNYFRFAYAAPRDGAPLSITTEVASCPWNPRHRLALIGLQARRDDPERAPARNLVFLLDVSGSMTPADRLPLVKAAMRMLVDTLTVRDRVAIVVYAGASGLVLPPTPGNRKADIHRALDQLQAGGSTNGAAGIQLAYDTAAEAFATGGVNRVVLATDGDFNVGVTSQGDLVRLIERQRERGIFLSVLGVGDDNLKDSTMEKLADRGNGNYAYLDSLDEARRVLVAEASSTLVAIAKDVKIQVEFNPRRVSAYRLVGYENRLLNREDFNDDRKDAGDIGAGYTVTALYEVVPAGEPVPNPGGGGDPLKYQEARSTAAAAASDELMTVKLRYKQPDGTTSHLLSEVVRDRAGQPSATLGFAAAVAQFGMLLRDSEFKGSATWDSVQAEARRSRGEDADGYRAEFIRLVDLAAALQGQEPERETRR